jgi:hypothetical protein
MDQDGKQGGVEIRIRRPHIAGLLRQVVKVDPCVASGGSSEVFPSNLLAFLEQIWINAIGIEGLCINLSGLRINLEARLLLDCEPLFHVRFL